MLRTILIVDDHAGFRAQARRLLSSEGFAVIGEAATAASGLELARRLTPDVVLLDVQLPDGDGFDVAAALHGQRSAVVLVSSRDAATYGDRIQASGARGFVAKDELSGAALAAVLEG